ncbi:flagellar basal-body rod protein FlgG [Humidesulfovibrio mexicanus]|uniref:Flagellar basal-body rod protein FlgG n=1 Tax=Humidesulfovibrio mexicanus TaxID=147047 RepID=A0A238Y0Z3_9BACT|nr:flagellar basal-body rod protein FlgF [Humidesulfovibrio mexicanus]SNR64441.1 flagellar basal-body rod protein FlgG [Humidesulfovibrio mexicanus]
MRESMYSALFGAMSNEMRLNTIANNLANVNTTGFKKDAYAFHDTFQRFAHDYLPDDRVSVRDKEIWPRAYVMARPRLSNEYSDQSQGGLQVTGNPLDLALVGKGYFKVRTPDGDMLTRSGSFQLGADGQLITEQGYEVLGDGGSTVTLPRDNKIEIDANGRVTADGVQLSQLDLVDVSDVRFLEKQGKNLYRIQPGSPAQEIPAEEIAVQQGYLEKSNVEIVSEMVNMMEAQRAFEISQKLMTTTDSMESLVINKVGQIS